MLLYPHETITRSESFIALRQIPVIKALRYYLRLLCMDKEEKRITVFKSLGQGRRTEVGGDRAFSLCSAID